MWALTLTEKTLNLTGELYRYLLKCSLREPAALQRLREAASSYPETPRLQISPDQAQFIAFLIPLMNAKKTLDIGTFMGYSALAVALALPEDGKVITCDQSAHFPSIGQPFWESAGVAHKIELIISSASELLEQLLDAGQQSQFDFIFIDADKLNNEQYYEKTLQLVRPGGLIAIDNVLWYGQVIDENDQKPSTQAIRAFNEERLHDARVDLTMLPVGDGLTLTRKL